MDDLPFALWLGMIPTVRVESKGLWGRLFLSLWLISSEYSSLPSTSGAGITAERTWHRILTERLKNVWPSGKHYSFPSASSTLPGSCASCPPPGYWILNSFSLHLQISIQSNLWLPPYPSPIPHLQMALKKGNPRWVFQFILSKNICISSVSRPCPESSTSPARWLSLAEEWRCRWGYGVVRVSGVGDSFQMTRDELE